MSADRRRMKCDIRPMDDELIDTHLRWLRRVTPSKDTCSHRRDVLRRVARQLPVSLREATAGDLDRWQEQLTVCRSSVYTYTVHVRAFYKWLHELGGREDNPAANLPVPRIAARRPRPFPESDLSLAFRCADDEMRAWIALAGWCGCRAAEIAILDDNSVIEEPDEQPLLWILGKGGRERLVPIPDDVMPLIRLVMRRGRWFRTPTGLLANGNYVTRKSSAYLTSIGLPYTLHQLRHRFGTQHYRICRDLRATQEAMGHLSPSTTSLYVQLAQQTAVRSMNKLGKTLPKVARPKAAPA